MASHHHVSVDTDQRFVLAGKAQSRLLIALVVGLVLTLVGCIMAATGIGEGHHEASPYTSLAQAPVKIGERLDGAQHEAQHEAHTAPAHGQHNDATGHEGEELKGTSANEHGAAHGAEHVGAAHTAGHAAAEGHHAYSWWKRLWANLWLEGVFFTGLAVIGVFFVAIQYVSQAGWSAGIVRVPMSFASFLPISGAVMLVVFLIGQHDLFHWTDASLYNKDNPATYDAILDGKKGYLNVPFFLVRMVGFIGLWWFFSRLIKGNSLKEDAAGKTHSFWRKNHQLSAIFLVIFAVSSSMVGWDWLMSIEPHWYSTLFGWYTFASWHVSGWAVIALTVTYLKDQGYLKHVNDSVLHDIGKFMFALSIFWSYLWVAQYLLIWYANIPEEAIYFIERAFGFDGLYKPVFFLNIIINFAFPLLFLMTRDAKRTPIFLKVAAWGILMGHWLDFYLMIMPGTVGGHAGFGFIEFGLLITFIAGFILVVSKALASAPLVAKNHPMLEESLHHDI